MLNFRTANINDIESACSWIRTDEEHFLWTGSDLSRPSCAKDLSDIVESPQVRSYVGVNDAGDAISYCELHELDAVSEWYRLVRLVVEPSHRGGSVGGETVRYMVGVARELSAKRFDLIVFPSNANAVRLYAQNGFAIEATLKRARVFNHRTHNILIMTTFLGR